MKKDEAIYIISKSPTVHLPWRHHKHTPWTYRKFCEVNFVRSTARSKNYGKKKVMFMGMSNRMKMVIKMTLKVIAVKI